MFEGIRRPWARGRLQRDNGFPPKVCQIANNEQDETSHKTKIGREGLTVAMIRIVVVFIIPPSNLGHASLFQGVLVTF